MAINETKTCMKLKDTTNDNHSLLFMENLTLPSFQVVVITANLECNGCIGRVSRLVSKMTGLTEYTVDMRKKEVTVKGDFISHGNFREHDEILRSRTLKSGINPPKSLSTSSIHFDNHLD